MHRSCDVVKVSPFAWSYKTQIYRKRFIAESHLVQMCSGYCLKKYCILIRSVLEKIQPSDLAKTLKNNPRNIVYFKSQKTVLVK